MSSLEEGSTRRGRLPRVLEQAAKALNSRGVSQTSLAEVAQRLGVSRAALYYYFADQEDLVFQCYRQTCEMMRLRLQEARRGDGGALEVVGRFIDGMLADEAPEFAALGDAAYLSPERRQIIAGLYRGVLSEIANGLAEGAERGELRRCDADVAAQAILGLVSWTPLARAWRMRAPLSTADLVGSAKSLLNWGVAARRSEPPSYVPFDLSPRDVPVDRVFDAGALAAAKQEALLASASWLFNLKGIDATSLDEIAERVGVTKRVIYHNVGDKETLVIACYRRSFRFHEGVGERVARYDGTRLDAFCASTQANAEASLREDIAPLATLANLEALPPAARDEIEAAGQRLMERYLDAFAVGQAEGSVRAVPSPALLAMHPGIFQWLPKWFETLTPAQRIAAPAELAELTRLGLRPL